MLNCLGLLEGLAQGSKPVQELARKQSALPLLVRCLGLALRLEGSRSQEGAQQAAELRRNGALAVTSLVAGNAAAIKQAKAAGAVEALLALLDRGADDEVLALNLTLTLTLPLPLTLTLQDLYANYVAEEYDAMSESDLDRPTREMPRGSWTAWGAITPI